MSFNKDALIHKLQNDLDKLKRALKSWIDVDMLDKVPTYIENRDLRNERTRYMLDREQYKATIDMLREEQDKDERDNMKEIVREALYGFIDHYTSDEFERVDLKIIADNYIENDCGKEE